MKNYCLNHICYSSGNPDGYPSSVFIVRIILKTTYTLEVFSLLYSLGFCMSRGIFPEYSFFTMIFNGAYFILFSYLFSKETINQAGLEMKATRMFHLIKVIKVILTSRIRDSSHMNFQKTLITSFWDQERSVLTLKFPVQKMKKENIIGKNMIGRRVQGDTIVVKGNTSIKRNTSKSMINRRRRLGSVMIVISLIQFGEKKLSSTQRKLTD